MAFAFGQKTNLVQSGRSGINPIKWGFVADIPQLSNGDGIDGSEAGGIYSSTLMYIDNTPTVCGTVPSCIGDFGTKSGLGYTSGNNINNDFLVLSKEEWRNIGIPPSAMGITFYIQTRPGQPANVVANPNTGCGIRGGCYTTGAGGDDCECDYINGKSTPPLNCDSDCEFWNYCCPATAADGGEAGNYVVYIDLSNVTQQYLYLYTSWFNGTMEPTGCSKPSDENDICTDNMRFVLFPSDGTEDDPTEWPHSDMTNPFCVVSVYKGGHFSEAADRLTGANGVCQEVNAGSPCVNSSDDDGCGRCNFETCQPCSNTIGPIGSDSTCVITVTSAGIAAGLSADTIVNESKTVEEFWGPNGTGVDNNEPSGFWGEVFDWTTEKDEDWQQANVGGVGGTACTVVCGDAGSYPIYAGCSCDSEGETGGQAVGFWVG